MDWTAMFQDPQRVGLMVLITVGAAIVGRIVYNLWPKTKSPAFWGSAAAFLVVGALAYMGIPEAGIVAWLFIGIAVIFGAAALVL
ncbi:MAG: hypothetical protein B7Y80_05375 [Hyphomicrobium sp. 32-62-53]|nr:MAG: hypothetical protein B7Z29_11110 [Hyphomicrobium sp. 12-62-95]OYY00677.1 MAG: hypothetical protein B7Y80_05375 [Hyphomicrobium sp. 32-62-53]